MSGTDDSDWDAPARPGSGLFGSDTAPADAEVVVLGVPWEPTTSYGKGTAATPGRIVQASHQLDLYDAFLGRPVGPETAYVPPSDAWRALNERACAAAARGDTGAVNAASAELNAGVAEAAAAHLAAGRAVGVLGGDHSAPYGAIVAVAASGAEALGILHVDAHHDLRVAYQGFEHSHASIMHNVLSGSAAVERVVSVGIRDHSLGEHERAASEQRLTTFYDHDLKRARYRGRTWADLCAEIVAPLPARVYVSFDVDGLDPRFCPGTGTPVPGGLEYTEAVHLLHEVVASGRHIVGFDLSEVSAVPGGGEWDLNVGARLLHKLAALASLG